jgi:hypothetical protein
LLTGEQALRAAVTKLSQVENSCGKAAKEVEESLDKEEREEARMEAEHGPRVSAPYFHTQTCDGPKTKPGIEHAQE